jgi:hypothetical protein
MAGSWGLTMGSTRMRKGLAVVAIGVAVFATLGEATKSNTAEKVAPGDTGLAAASSGTTITPVFQVGDEVKLGDWRVKVHTVTDPLVSTNEFFEPKPGNRFIAIDTEVTNTTSRPQTVSSLLCFELQDDKNQSYDQAITGDTSVKSPDGEVDAKGSRRGVLTYEVPTSATGLKLRFKCELFSKGSAIIALG